MTDAIATVRWFCGECSLAHVDAAIESCVSHESIAAPVACELMDVGPDILPAQSNAARGSRVAQLSAISICTCPPGISSAGIVFPEIGS
jgi:hypothetical protein